MARFNVDFSDETIALLEKLANAQDTSKADVLRKAISLENWITETLKSGSKIVIEAPDGRQREVVRF